jgi:hypothetical protein
MAERRARIIPAVFTEIDSLRKAGFRASDALVHHILLEAEEQ